MDSLRVACGPVPRVHIGIIGAPPATRLAETSRAPSRRSRSKSARNRITLGDRAWSVLSARIAAVTLACSVGVAGRHGRARRIGLGALAAGEPPAARVQMI